MHHDIYHTGTNLSVKLSCVQVVSAVVFAAKMCFLNTSSRSMHSQSSIKAALPQDNNDKTRASKSALI